jgi:hypothetical protein
MKTQLDVDDDDNNENDNDLILGKKQQNGEVYVISTPTIYVHCHIAVGVIYGNGDNMGHISSTYEDNLQALRVRNLTLNATVHRCIVMKRILERSGVEIYA